MPDQPATAVIQRREASPRDQLARMESLINEKRDAIVATLAPTISADRFISVSLAALSRSPKLLECSPASILKSLRDAAELGLEPSGLMGQAYLVPYYNKYAKRLDAQLIPGYRGLIDLARRTGELINIEAHVVREGDAFDFHRDEHGTHFRHEPPIRRTVDPDTGEVVDRGGYVGAYAVARLRAAGEGSSIIQFEWMDAMEVEAIRGRSKAAGDGPWNTDWSEMAKKTVTRRLLKYLPIALSSPVNRAMELEDAAESGAERRSAVTVSKVADDTTDAPDGALGPGATASDDADDAPDPTPEPEPEAPTPTRARKPKAEPEPAPGPCGAPDPFGEDKCTLPSGHAGGHANDNARWPAAKG